MRHILFIASRQKHTRPFLYVAVNMCTRDDMESNASMFSVEMKETAAILNTADVIAEPILFEVHLILIKFAFVLYI